MGRFRAQRQSVLGGTQSGSAVTGGTDFGAYASGSDMAADSMDGMEFAGISKMQQQLTRALMHGVIVVAISSAVSGTSPFSREALMTGLMTGAGSYVVDSYAPTYGEAFRTGAVASAM